MATIELNRRRVLSAILIIGLAAAGAGAGTMAFFSDTESSTNTIEAGTLNLQGPVSGNLTVSDTVPDTWHNTTLNVSYQGSVVAEVDMNVTLSEPSSDPASETNAAVDNDLSATQFAAEIEVANATLYYGGHSENLVDVANNDTDGSGAVELDEFADAAPFDNVTGSNVEGGETIRLDMDLYFKGSAGNEAQADGVNATVDIIAEQRQAD